MPPPPLGSRRSALQSALARPTSGAVDPATAPPVYRPATRAQPKIAVIATPARSSAPRVYRPANSVAAAPPVYSPNVASLLQRKSAVAPPPIYRPGKPTLAAHVLYHAHPAVTLQQKPGATAPPVYRPGKSAVATPTAWNTRGGFKPSGARHLGFPHFESPIGRAPSTAQRQRATAQYKAASSFSSPTIQRMQSAVGKIQDYYYSHGLSESECKAVMSGGMIDLDFGPIHGTFSANNLTGDLHVRAANKSENIQGNLIAALKKMKNLMEYAAFTHDKNVKTAKIELRPTGGVVVKQMIEALAFMGLGLSQQYKLKEKINKLKERRNLQIAKLKDSIALLKRKRDGVVIGTPLEPLHVVLHQLGPKHVPSPGMGELLNFYEQQTGWRQLQDEIDKLEEELENFAGTRQGEFMGEAFFDEHFYMLHSLIGRGGNGDFSVSAYGLINDLPDYTPAEITTEFGTNENLLLGMSQASDMARALYRARLSARRSSLKIMIYYSGIDQLIGFVKQ
jgi:hypothetical protein